MDDLISRSKAIRWVKAECNPYGQPTLDYESGIKVIEHLKRMPSAQPERLNDDDFETIRIHLSAYKEKLCNQKRYKEAEEYQRIIDRFMSFASAQPELQWISGSEIPEDGRYLCDYGDCIDFGRVTNGKWYVDGVIAYMPLPEAYKGG